METNKIYNTDCLDGLKLLDNESIDMVLTSPPYDNLRKYNGYSFDFENIAKQLYRVIKQGGIVVWVVADQTINGSETGTSFKQALFFKETGFNLHDTMIYAKNNPIPLTHNRYEQHFEYMFIFSKGKPKTFNPIMVENKLAGKKRSEKTKYRQQNNELRKINTTGKVKGKSIKGNIWYYSVGGNLTNHPAIFPEELAQDHILSWSNKDNIVLDPFMGSGTTAKVCLKTNRKYIGFEISKEYCEIANRRVQDVCCQLDLFKE